MHFLVVKNAYPHKPHQTTPQQTTTQQQRPKGSKESKLGAIHPNPKTDLGVPAGPQGGHKSKSYIKPEVNVSGSPTSYV